MSTDATVERCRRFTDRVLLKEWQGHVRQKNYALQFATHEWVLCLDADERVTAELRKEIEEHLARDQNTIDGYLFPRHSYYLGRWINHGGWYPDYKLRLFKRSKGHWGGKDPHDRVNLEGATAYLNADLHHYVSAIFHTSLKPWTEHGRRRGK